MKVVAVLLSLLGLCCAFGTIEQAVKQFNDESHLLFTDPKAEKWLRPCENLRVFTKDNIVVPELELEDEIVAKALEDALRDFETNYHGKKDREWKRVIAARKNLVAATGDDVGEKQEAFLRETIDLISQHYERKALEAEAVAIVFQEDLLDTPGASLEERISSEKRHKYGIKALSGKFGILKELLELGGDVVPLPEISKSTFDKVVELSSENQGLSAKIIAKILVAVDYLDISGEAASIFYRNLALLVFGPSTKNIENFLGEIDAFLSSNNKTLLGTSCIRLFSDFLDQFKLEIEVSGQVGTVRQKRENCKYGNADSITYLKQIAFKPSALNQIPQSLNGSPRFSIIAWFLLHMEISSLVLEGYPIKNEDIDYIASIGLKELCLYDCSLNSEKITRLLACEKMRNITILDLSRNHFGNEGAVAIAEKLIGLPNLSTLNLRWNDIRDEDARHIAEHLKDVPGLTNLDLGYNKILTQGAWHIAKHLKDAKNLTTLSLGGCEIGEKGAKHIAEYLKDAKNLSVLDLKDNKIGPAGAEYVAEHLKDVPNLTTLDLERNEIGERGAWHIAKHLKDVPNLTTLDLKWNGIGESGAWHIAKHLKDVPNLTTLDLRWNRIGDECAKHIAEYLKDAKNLITLNFGENRLAYG